MKTALITGGAKRLGRSMALALAERGYAIALHYRGSVEDASRTQNEIRKLGGVCELFQADLSKHQSVSNIFPQVTQKMGKICILINSVSVFYSQNLMETQVEQFDKDIAVNLRAPFFLTQDFARQAGDFQPREPLIINVLDTRITKVQKNYCVYTLTKHALHQFTRIAAVTLAPQVRVNALAPGPALPPPGASEEHLHAVIKKTPLGVSSGPAELTKGLHYLLDAQTVTGEVLYIDSGQHL